jgi:acylphosphatase
MVRRIRAIVTGHVQGVSFRAATRVQARRLGLIGWVKNRSDGSVELEAEGDDGKLAELVAWCEHGPPSARVARVDVQQLAATGAERDFDVTR